MYKNLLTQLSVLLCFFIAILVIVACKKEEAACPLQEYTIQCDIRTWDAEFGGYDEATQTFTMKTHCPEDADAEAQNMSYDLGEVYKHCKVVP